MILGRLATFEELAVSDEMANAAICAARAGGFELPENLVGDLDGDLGVFSPTVRLDGRGIAGAIRKFVSSLKVNRAPNAELPDHPLVARWRPKSTLRIVFPRTALQGFDAELLSLAEFLDADGIVVHDHGSLQRARHARVELEARARFDEWQAVSDDRLGADFVRVTLRSGVQVAPGIRPPAGETMVLPADLARELIANGQASETHTPASAAVAEARAVRSRLGRALGRFLT